MPSSQKVLLGYDAQSTRADMVHNLDAGTLQDAQLAEVLLGHDAQRRQINLRVPENVQVFGEAELLEQLVDGAFQRAPPPAAAATHARGAPPAAAAADSQAPHASGLAAVVWKPVRLPTAVLAGAAAAGASLVAHKEVGSSGEKTLVMCAKHAKRVKYSFIAFR